MEILVKNGEEAVWAGGDGPWQWRSASEFMRSEESQNTNMSRIEGAE
jgi:hypothetical protein